MIHHLIQFALGLSRALCYSGRGYESALKRRKSRERPFAYVWSKSRTAAIHPLHHRTSNYVNDKLSRFDDVPECVFARSHRVPGDAEGETGRSTAAGHEKAKRRKIRNPGSRNRTNESDGAWLHEAHEQIVGLLR